MDSNIYARLIKLQGSLTIEEFAKKLGVPYTTLHSYLAGKKGKRPSIPPSNFLEKVVRKTTVNAHWLLTGEGPMERMAGTGSGIAEEIQNDPKLIDIFQLLKGDRDARDAIYELLVGAKQFERVAKIMKKLMNKKIEALTLADLTEDPILADIARILKKNPAAKHVIYKILETDMSCTRSLEIFRKHFGEKFAEKVDPPPGNSAGL